MTRTAVLVLALVSLAACARPGLVAGTVAAVLVAGAAQQHGQQPAQPDVRVPRVDCPTGLCR